MTRVSVGIDIGGSHIGIGFLDANGALLLKSDVKIQGAIMLADSLIVSILQLIQNNCNSTWEVSSIGIGCPGQSKNGVIVAASNLPLVKNFNIVDKMGIVYPGIPIVVLNDADAALAAEMWGVHRKVYANVKNAVLITLGTGIGVGLMLNGQLYQGTNGLIEAGHMIVTNAVNSRICGCGQRGCVEVYSSATNTSKRLQELDVEFKGMLESSPVSEEVSTIGGSAEVFERFFKQDVKAIQVLEESCDHLATLCINLCRVVDPEIIVFGGGMANAGQPLLDLINKHISIRTWTVLPTDVKLSIAKSGSDNGIIGAALAAAQRIGDNAPPQAPSCFSAKALMTEGKTPHMDDSDMAAAALAAAQEELTQAKASAAEAGKAFTDYGLFLSTTNAIIAAVLLKHAVRFSLPELTAKGLSEFFDRERMSPTSMSMLFLTSQALVGAGFMVSFLKSRFSHSSR